MLLDRDLKHLAGAGAVNVTAFLEDRLPPDLSGVPGDDAGLDGREVRHQKLCAVLGYESSPDQLRERIRYVLIQELYGIEVTGADESTGLGQIREVILGQVLQLDIPSGEPACTGSAEELEHATGTVVRADGILHRLVFPYGGLGQLLPQGQDLPEFFRRVLQKLRHGLLVEGLGLHAVIREPLLHLLYTVGILQ